MPIFPVTVHSWGGLGSQLFAVVFALDLKSINPQKKIIICHHSSGVTRRDLDLPPSLDSSGIRTKFIDDFQQFSNATEKDSTTNPRTGIKMDSIPVRHLKSILDGLGVVVSTDPPDSSIRPWTIQVRSSYSNRRISKESLSKLISLFFVDHSSLEANDSCMVHLRMGDLITLSTKAPLDRNRVVGAIRNAVGTNPLLQMRIASDSPELISTILRDNKILQDYEIYSGTAIATLIALSTSKVMIASASKLSIWGILLGIELNIQRTVYIPQELGGTIEVMVENSGRTKMIKY